MLVRSKLWWLLFALLVSSGCEQAADPERVPPARPAVAARAKLNVVLVSVDTTRADHLGCYGHPVVKTPAIDQLAAEGTRFAQAISPAPVTLPAHASLFTGTYPFVHGARSNGTYTVGPENSTLSEQFQQAGYATGAEVAAAVMGRLYGLDQGFDHYGDLLDEDAAERVAQTYQAERTAERITERGLAFLDAHQDEPFFLFLHYYDPHEPYAPPEPYKSQYRNPYHGELAYFDEHFGRLMARIRGSKLRDNTLVILTSDHGEALGEHNELGHAFFLYDATLRIPLIFWGPGHIPAGQVVDAQVRLIDVAPTLWEWFGWSRPAEMQGLSLLPLIDGAADGWTSPGSYSETFYPTVVFGYAHLRSLRSDTHKYVHAPQPELYDLQADPGELKNLAASDPERVKAMRSALRQLLADAPQRPSGDGARIAMSDAQRRKLEALGYIGGGESEELIGDDELENFDSARAELKDHLQAIQLNGVGMQQMRAEDWAAAVDTYTKLLAVAPESGAAYIELGRAQSQLQQLEAALASYRKAAALQPNNAVPMYSIGQLLLFQGQMEAAQGAWEEAIRIDPSWVDPYVELGRLLTRQQRHADAQRVLQAALAVADYSPTVYVLLGRTQMGLRDVEAAEASFRKAIALERGNIGARIWLARLLLGNQRVDEGVTLLEETAALAPKDPRALDQLASHFARGKDFARAIRYYRRAVEATPEKASRHHNLGTALRQSGEREAAIEPLREALRLSPTSTISLDGLLQIYRELDRLDEAVTLCEEVAARGGLNHRGVVLMLEFLVEQNACGQARALVDGQPEAARAAYADLLGACGS